MFGKYLPRLILTGLSLMVVALSVFATQKGPEEILEGNVLSEKTESTVIPGATSSSSPNVIVSPVATPIPTPVSTPQTQTSDLNDWFYPGSSVVANTGLTLSLRSGDDTGVITDWYKAKIIEKGANVKSFVTTSTNGEILNKLAGASSEFEINIEISKPANDSETIIVVIQT